MMWSSRNKEEIPASPVLMPKAIWQVLYSRDIKTSADIENLFSPKLKDLADPFCLSGMAKATDRIAQAIHNKEKIAVYADYDLDGSPGGVLMKRGLEQLGATEVLLRQPKRLSEGYGVHKHIIKDFAEQQVSLVITVDVGITDLLAADYCKELGIDLIVTDHHLPKETLPEAIAIVNPNSGVCESGLGHLSGTGVAFYVIMALRTKLNVNLELKNYLDLFAIATVTDMVPLVAENRVLIKHGLKVLEKTQWPGLRALLDELGFRNKALISSDIGFRIAPKLNALSRLEEDLLPVDVLLADAEVAKTVSKKVIELNDKRKKLQEEAFDDALGKLDFNFSKENSPACVTVFSEEYHPGVVSVVANKLMEHYGRPTFIACEKKPGVVVGSARSPHEKINLQDVLSANSEHLVKFGGHKMAAGFEIQKENIADFFAALEEYFQSSELDFLENDFRYYDAEVELEELNESFMRWYLGMEPFGVGFDEPLFLMRNLKIKTIKELKKPHLKLILTDGQRGIEALWFSAPEEHGLIEGQFVDVLGQPGWNEWMGRKRIQWQLAGIRPN